MSNPNRARPSLIAADAIGVAALLAIAGIAWIALAPLRIWHVTGADGQQHPDAATWIAYGISGGVILAALMFFSIRASAKAAATARRASSITEAMRIMAVLEDRSGREG